MGCWYLTAIQRVTLDIPALAGRVAQIHYVKIIYVFIPALALRAAVGLCLLPYSYPLGTAQ